MFQHSGHCVLQPPRIKKFKLFDLDQIRKPQKIKVLPWACKGYCIEQHLHGYNLGIFPKGALNSEHPYLEVPTRFFW